MTYGFSRRTFGLRSSAIRDLLKLTEVSGMLSLAGGFPAPDSFPLDDLRREADLLLAEYGPRAVQYSATDGVVELRTWIADAYTHAFGRRIPVDGQIVVTHGSQQALDLLAKVLIDPGDVVVTESPAYLGALQAMELFQPRFEIVAGDEHGMRIDILAERLAAGLRPKFVYVVPNFHNPSGGLMPVERRRQLAELAERYDLLIVEDDPYGAISFDGPTPQPIACFTDRVVHLSTFSKIVAPGFRVGWMIGPPEVIAWVGRAKQAADLHTSSFSQLLLAGLVSRSGWLAAQRARIVPLYQERCTALADALDTTFADRITFSRPGGGLFLWATFPEIADTAGLLAAAIRRGVAFVPGKAFTIDQNSDSNARFSYSTIAIDQIDEAVARLSNAVADLMT